MPEISPHDMHTMDNPAGTSYHVELGIRVVHRVQPWPQTGGESRVRVGPVNASLRRAVAPGKRLAQNHTQLATTTRTYPEHVLACHAFKDSTNTPTLIHMHHLLQLAIT